jgi:biopolymer transport protein ExbD
MPIVTPGKRPGVRLSKSKVFGKKLKGGKKGGYANLNLTPMVDMFTIIVIYLLQNFSADGEILFMSKEIKLPSITAKLQLERAPVIGVSDSSISLNGRFIVDVSDITRDDTWNVPALEETLLEERKKIEQANAMMNRGADGFKGIVNVQADRKIPFKILKKVMFACNASGFGNINFAGVTVSAKGATTPSAAANP